MNQKMNEHGNNSLLTPPPENHELSAKRQKLDTTNSSSSNFAESASSDMSKWKSTLLIKELTACRNRLSDTEATAMYVRQMRAEAEKTFIKKAGMLQLQARMEREMIENLETRLEELKRSHQETDPKVAIKAEESPMESMMRERIESLFAEDPRLNKHVLFVKSEAIPSSSKHQVEESMTLDMKPILQEGMKTLESTRQVDIQSQNNQEEKSQSAISGLDVRGSDRAFLLARTNELEEQLQSAKNMILTLHEAAKEKVVLEKTVAIMEKKLKAAEEVKQLEMHSNCEGISTGVRRNESGDSEIPSANSKQENCLQRERPLMQEKGKKRSADDAWKERQKSPGRNSINESTENIGSPAIKVKEEPSIDIPHEKNSRAQTNELTLSENPQVNHQKAHEAPEPEESRQLKVGNYHILVSHSKFLTIVWSKFYQKIDNYTFSCNKCPAKKNDLTQIEDHVWVQHCGGTFKCPHCPQHSQPLLTRYDIGEHMRECHSDKYLPKK